MQSTKATKEVIRSGVNSRASRLAPLLLVFLFFFSSASAQDEEIKFNTFLHEMGVGYPISLKGGDQILDVYMNLGYKKPIHKGLLGIIIGSQFRMEDRSDYAFNTKLRWGRTVGQKSILSFDLGYTFYSYRYKEFPGLTFGLNLQNENHIGLHLRYDTFNSEELGRQSNLVFGFHLTDKKASKVGLPVFGAIAGLMGILAHIIHQSR
ncbi:MAG: hypothetical protein AAGA77_12075 [Bacteroidota bacterium]